MSIVKGMLHSLKNMDLLGKPVEMEINSKHTKQSRTYKTWPGFFFTLLCVVLGVTYLSYLIHKMN